jgi:hypothetical protein
MPFSMHPGLYRRARPWSASGDGWRPRGHRRHDWYRAAGHDHRWDPGHIDLGERYHPVCTEEQHGPGFCFRRHPPTHRKDWLGSYILALIILWVVAIIFGFIAVALALIPFIGWLILLFLYPVWFIFVARYVTLIYESATEPA